ncbi:MAG: GAF domain-containing protein, partial [Leptolyngbyaceae cyanobacterium RM2_2_21]|nr:GAF domain-containing protein [Leptolyngbyaceae cyanobacterium RM2_2_21]
MNSASPLEQNLYSFQEQPALILEKVDDAIALLDAEQHLVLFNQKLVRILHLESVWLKQSPRFSEILAFLVEQNTWSSEQRDRALQACEHTSGENQVIQINQNDQIYLDLYITSTSTGGKLLIFRDLTAQRRAQHDLADEVRRLTFLLGLTERLQTSDNLIQIGRFALTYLVKAMGAAFGDVKVIGGKGSDRSAGKLTNLISGQFIATHGESVAETMQQRLDQGVAYGQGILWQVVETGQPCFVEDYATHPNAVKEFRHPAIGQLGIFPIPSADGTIIGVLTLESRSLQKLQEAPQQDMLLAACRTLGAAIERAQSQERLQRINQDLELASRLKSEFLASMSHELRTPLNSILGFSELLLRQREGLNSRKVGHVSLIHKSGQHLLHLINDILDLSKVEAGKVDLELNTVSIQALCRQCLQMIQPRAERKRLALSLELDYQLDQVVIDERRVRQIVINLLSNAVKFTPEKGKVKLSVQVAYGNQLLQDTRPDESPVNLSTPYLCIAVTDTGIGIEAEKKHLLFRPFQQIDASLTRRHEGTGLGLALTKRLAELHGGTVSFVSQLGEGSTFRVWLPLNELRETGRSITASVAAGSPSPDQSTSSQAQDRVAQPCVLVVEDQPYNQSLIAEILEMEGYAVNIIADGQTMLETLGSPLVTARSLP